LTIIAAATTLSAVIGARFAQPAPEFSLPSTLGRPVSLGEYRGQSDVVLAFYCYDFGNI
jgi:peroxiredoxin